LKKFNNKSEKSNSYNGNDLKSLFSGNFFFARSILSKKSLIFFKGVAFFENISNQFICLKEKGFYDDGEKRQYFYQTYFMELNSSFLKYTVIIKIFCIHLV
jgi:hypothetical protein